MDRAKCLRHRGGDQLLDMVDHHRWELLASPDGRCDPNMLATSLGWVSPRRSLVCHAMFDPLGGFTQGKRNVLNRMWPICHHEWNHNEMIRSRFPIQNLGDQRGFLDKKSFGILTCVFLLQKRLNHVFS